MLNDEHNVQKRLENLFDKIDSLESRLSILENNFSSFQPDVQASSEMVSRNTSPEKELQIDLNLNFNENKIGEFGLAWLGNLVLLFGITFLTEFIAGKGYVAISSLVGFASVAGIFILSYRIRKSLSHMSYMFEILGYLLIYYFTLRLHFFTENPLIENNTIGITLLVLATTIQLFMAARKRSELFAVMGIVFLIFTSIVANNTNIMLLLCAVAAAVSMFLFFKLNLSKQLVYSLLLIYFALLLCLFNNPIMTHQSGMLKINDYGFVSLFIIGSLFSLSVLKKENKNVSHGFLTSVILINGFGFTLLLFLNVISFFQDNYIWLFISIFVFTFIYAVFIKVYTDWKTIRALYALYSFTALSVALYGIFGFPQAFMLLAIESLLVVSMALWFRSKFIVFMNMLLFAGLIIAYISLGDSSDMVNFSFAIVSLITARILNWQSERLEIKTDFLRNAYLFFGFVMMLYALHKAVPDGFVTVSWTILALLYFGMSILMKNIKYRWLAIFTFLATAFYLFIVDLQKIDLIYRVLAFMVLAVISIGISIYYTKRHKSTPADPS